MLCGGGATRFFMAPPVFADMAVATGDKKYLEFMDRSWDSTAALLYDHAKHLYFRDATFLDKHEKNGEPLLWARGNGWVMGGIVRVLERLPADSPLRPKYVALRKDMAAEMDFHSSKDGLWRPRTARCRCLSAAGDFGQRVCDLRARVRRE